MTDPAYPLETQRFGRSQTPESPQPVHIPEPSNIPVLENQLDSVFNDTATYDIRPADQPLAHTPQNEESQNPFAKSLQATLADERPLALEGSFQQASAHVPANTGHAFFPSSFVEADVTSVSSHGPFAHNATGNYLQTPLEPNDESDPYEPSASSQAFDTTKEATSDELPISSNPEPVREEHSSIYAAPEYGTSTNHSQPVHIQEQGVDYQSFLEQFSTAAATAPSADTVTAPTTGAANAAPMLGEKPLQPVSGLPPKPPPRENQTTSEDASEYPQFYTPGPQTVSAGFGLVLDAPMMNQSATHGNKVFPEQTPVVGASGLPPPPQTADAQNPFQSYRPSESAPGENSPPSSSVDRPWSPQTQIIYDQFLDDERMYVTEGVWDRFPVGSRLFVGNLPTEKVTKRDLFHVFHRHGKLAQISIKQAYGFVQFLDSQSCHDALLAEQAIEIRGRKVHLEVSKPQKNTRPSGGAGGRSNNRRRSRSPVRRDDRLPFSDFRDEPGRRRDDYRPRRSPSPRTFRSRDDFRMRSPRSYGQYDNRPGSSGFGSSYRPPSPPPFDEDAALPLPRRAPQDVPDVQLLVLEEVAPQFVNFVEQGFRQKALKASTIWLNPRLTLEAVVKRQIREGVQAVVKLSRGNQYSGRIPLQVFDRTQGASNVRFNEYVDLDIHIAADVVMHQRQRERTVLHTPSTAQYNQNSPYDTQPNYGFPTTHQPQPQPSFNTPTFPPYPPSLMPPQQMTTQPQVAQYQPPVLATGTPTAAGPNLQELLANLSQPMASQTPAQHTAMAQQNNRPTDLAGLLSNVAARQYNQAQPYQQNTSSTQYSNSNHALSYQNHTPTPQYGQGAPDLQGLVQQLQRNRR